MIESHIFSEIKSIQARLPEYKLIIFFHWNYELEKYPMPSQRELSHKLINMGVELIVGAHPHRIQGFEIYKGKPIIYSVGNFYLRKMYTEMVNYVFQFCNLEMSIKKIW